MACEERIQSLQAKHADLDAELKVETQRPLPDPGTVTKLKRLKLRLKDEIARLAQS